MGKKHKSLINHHRSRIKMNKGLRNLKFPTRYPRSRINTPKFLIKNLKFPIRLHRFPIKFLKFPIRLSRSQINLHKNLKALSPQVPKSLCPLLIKFRMRQNFIESTKFPTVYNNKYT